MAYKIHDWSEIFGHQNLIRLLKKQVERDNVPNVIIFYGNPGFGKSSMAKLLAIDVVTRYEDEGLKQEYIKQVIDENKSTDSIKLFNMSEIQEKEEEIQKVKAEFALGFSKTGRKVLILDEAHGISKYAQDSVLTELEHLPKGIYVFICTTEFGSLRAALVSRSKADYIVKDITEAEARQYTRKCIDEHRFKFNVSENFIVSSICVYALNQPRKIANLFENFEDGSIIDVKDLEVFMNVSSVSSVIEVMKYIYGSMSLGIEYLNTLHYDNNFVFVLLEITKVALGHTSSNITPEDTKYIKNFMFDKDETNLIRFTAEVAGLEDLRKRRVISAFMRANVNYVHNQRPDEKDESTTAMDFSIMSQNLNVLDVAVGSGDLELKRAVAAPTLDEIFATSDVVSK